jgi:dUTP pyrophosphatase
MEFDSTGFINLESGIYSITYNEIVHLPNNVMALARPRSSLLRCGVSVGTAVWDAGYSGRSESLLNVYHPAGFCIQKNSRVVQLVFFRLAENTEGYSGTYQNENIG